MAIEKTQYDHKIAKATKKDQKMTSKHLSASAENPYRFDYQPEKIIRYREKQGLSQTDLASIAKISRTSVKKAEKGDKTVRRATIQKIAEALHIELAEISNSTIQITNGSENVQESRNKDMEQDIRHLLRVVSDLQFRVSELEKQLQKRTK